MKIFVIFYFLTGFTSKGLQTLFRNHTRVPKSLNLPPTFHNMMIKNITGKLLEEVLMLLTHVKRFGRGENKKKILDNCPNPCLLCSDLKTDSSFITPQATYGHIHS